MAQVRPRRRARFGALLLLAAVLFACCKDLVAPHPTLGPANVEAPPGDSSLGAIVEQHAVKLACLIVVISLFVTMSELPPSPAPAEFALEKRLDYNKVLIMSAYLSWLSGFVNAVCILEMGMTVAHHTGNASHTGRLAGIDAQRFSMAMVGFWLGAAVAGFSKVSGETLYCGRYSPGLLSAAMAVAGAVFIQYYGGGPLVAVPLLAFSQGLQNAVTRKHSMLPICTTHMTGYLTDLGSGIGAWARGVMDGQGPGLKRPSFFALSILTFTLGGFAAKKCRDEYGILAALLPAGLMAVTSLGLVPMPAPKLKR